jgi:hypothetical protein
MTVEFEMETDADIEDKAAEKIGSLARTVITATQEEQDWRSLKEFAFNGLGQKMEHMGVSGIIIDEWLFELNDGSLSVKINPAHLN